jgi:hypothetical protein
LTTTTGNHEHFRFVKADMRLSRESAEPGSNGARTAGECRKRLSGNVLGPGTIGA